MKKFLFLVFVILLGYSLLPAVVSEYTFSSSVGTYTPITNGTVHGTAANDDHNFNAIPIGFDFVFDYNTTSVVSVNSNGFLVLGPTAQTSYVSLSNPNANASNRVVAVLNRDLKSKATGVLQSKLLGTAPDRIFVIQWANYQRYGSTNAGDTLNFQVRLYETTNGIEIQYGHIVFGNSNLTNNAFQVGLRGNSNLEFNNRSVIINTNTWSTSTTGLTNTASCAMSPSFVPENGLSFFFAPPNVATPPNAATISSPLDGIDNVILDAHLQWINGGGGTTGYSLFLGTDNPPTNIVNGLDLGLITNYTLSLLFTYATQYYWQIVPYNNNGNAVNCPIWSFTTVSPPLPASPLSPTDEVIGTDINATLNWAAGSGYFTGYKIYFGTDNPPTNIVNGTTQAETMYDPNPDMTYYTTYYWKIVPYNSFSDAEGCPVWSFTTKDPALPATNPSPVNNAANVSLNTLLTWENGGGNPTGYKVYLGTDNPPTNIINGSIQSDSSFDPDLLHHTTYYWKIIPFNQYGNAVLCPIWNFSTINPVQISPTYVDFGAVQIGQTSSYQQIIITNTGILDDLSVQQISLSGSNANDFELVNTNTLPYTLTPSQSISIQVRYCPLTSGVKQAAVSILIDNRNYDVTLTGSSIIFTEVNVSLPSTFDCAAAWGDYDNDGDLDIVVTGRLSGFLSYTSQVFRNNGNGTFTDITAGLIGVFGGSVDWGDYDNDGDLDILMTGCYLDHTYPLAVSKIYRNEGNGVFTDLNAGLFGVEFGAGTWGDYDNDGYIDVLLTGKYYDNDYRNTTKIYHNNGNSTFTEIVTNLPIMDCGKGVWGDYDNDGDLDILMSGSGASGVSRNDGNGVFTDIALLESCTYASPAWGDYDNDGDLDILLSGVYLSWLGYITSVYRNNGNDTFTDINTGFSGLLNGSASWGDYDNDGYLDILTTGGNYVVGPTTKLYHNNGNGTFTEIDAGLQDTEYGSVSWGDFDNDGDLDILLSGSYYTKVYRNGLNVSNPIPTTPTITYSISGGIKLHAQNSTDDTTPTQAVHYNFRAGLTPGGSNVISPMSISLGIRKVCSYGNAYSGSYNLEYAPNTSVNMYVAAQALDNTYTGSTFSNELHITTTTPSLQITYPNGGETIVSGTTSYIRWAANSVRSLNIKLTPNNGTTWIDITAQPVPSAPGLYYYSVPSLNSTTCKMKILWAKDGNYYDMSDAAFTIRNTSTQPLMEITYPITAIFTTPGRNISITWSSQNVTNVSLDYSIDNGYHWNIIVNNISASLSTYEWTVPDSITANARIRIRKADNATYYDVSDMFTICDLDLISPNGGETIQTDYSNTSFYDITWSSPYVYRVNLSYRLDDMHQWEPIATGIASTGYYKWLLPPIEGHEFQVRIENAGSTDINDASESTFTIQIPAWFTNVNGGGFLNNYSFPMLRWRIQNYNPATMVYIEFSPDQSTWTRSNTTPIQLGSLQYNCWLDVGTASQIWFRIIQSSNNRVLALSSNPVTITNKYLEIISPNGGETWPANSNQTIQWDVDGCSNFNIDYTIDNGLNWISIATEVPSLQLSYPWLIPDTPSTQCRIRIYDTTYNYMNLVSDMNFTITPFGVISPFGSFDADVVEGETPLTVHFTENVNPGSGTIVQRLWSFGDGATSTSANPTHTYTTVGTYSVSLYVQNSFDADATITRTNYITVLPNRPRIQLSAAAIDFGTVFVSNSANRTIHIRNIGTAPLVVNSISQANRTSVFSIIGFSPNTSIDEGDSLALNVRFTPTSMGTIEDSLTINSNSYIESISHVALSGYGGLIAPPKPPENVNIVMSADDAVISWDAVTENTSETPIVPDYYLVFFNGSNDTEGLYYFLAVTTNLSFIHQYVGLYSPSMFYRIRAHKNYDRNFYQAALPELTQQMTEEEVLKILKKR